MLRGDRCRYSYGDIELNAATGASINVFAIPSYTGSNVTISKDGVELSSSNGIALDAGTQSTISILVNNTESGIQLSYDIIVIRPKPDCSDSQLTPWCAT